MKVLNLKWFPYNARSLAHMWIKGYRHRRRDNCKNSRKYCGLGQNHNSRQHCLLRYFPKVTVKKVKVKRGAVEGNHIRRS